MNPTDLQRREVTAGARPHIDKAITTRLPPRLASWKLKGTSKNEMTDIQSSSVAQASYLTAFYFALNSDRINLYHCILTPSSSHSYEKLI